MRNYIILNNKDSRDITGLLIQELPPISKPKMRTSVEEIDGRDGDITTKLGYEAYDKEISIGLYGNYGIDKVIDYFNSEGTVIFSNEPDKYYKYSITEKIDFERLVRFRTATVTLHCQPFKYSAEEKLLTFTDLTDKKILVNNSGNIYAKPVITLYGTGTVNLSLNGNQLFVVKMGETTTNITLDISNMEAYTDSLDNLKNRAVAGDYDNFKLEIGKNTITWTGDLTMVTVKNVSRWI